MNTELWAIYKVLQLVWQGDRKRLKVKNDSLISVKLIKTQNDSFSSHLSLCRESDS